MKLARYMVVSPIDLGLFQNQILIELISYSLELLLSDQYGFSCGKMKLLVRPMDIVHVYQVALMTSQKPLIAKLRFYLR